MNYEQEFEFEGTTIVMNATVHAYGVYQIYTGDEGYTDMERHEDPIFTDLHYYDDENAKQLPTPEMEEMALELLTSGYWQLTAENNDVEGEY